MTFAEQATLQYMAGEEAEPYIKDCPRFHDAANQRVIVGNRSRSLAEYSERFTSKGVGNGYFNKEWEPLDKAVSISFSIISCSKKAEWCGLI